MSDRREEIWRGPGRWFRAPAVAAMFLTRLPIRAPQAVLADAAIAFPLVGALVGLLGGGVFWLAALAGLPPLASALLALAATVATTGALHEDGLADAADGLAGRTSEDAIRIMRDSRIGGYGVLAMIFSVGLRAAALAALSSPSAVVVALVVAASASRAAIPAVMLALPRATDTGQGASAGRPAGTDAVAGILLAALLALGAAGAPAGLTALTAAAAGAAAVAILALRRLGGYTGDILGTVQQIAEIAALLALAAVM